ncbi:hypothetical protein [Acidovorax sp.]|uniref:hypothetical protein n=1 Tax=Acidovorax sp. TaxID=1872122 RepID=UPI002ACD68B9|nr:hypothetical protein [Acidovorax sp.]MDZ7867347.1 hypothetical protein [Acidovorax sp.]
MAILPVTAHAHGAEVLQVLCALAASFGACLLALWLVPALRPHRWMGALGCVLGAVAAGWATRGLPFQAQRSLVTAAMVLGPLLGAAAAVGWPLLRRRCLRGNDGR